MRISSVTTIASVMLYHGILLIGARKGSTPTPISSYVAGLTAFSVPFLFLAAAEMLGLPRIAVKIGASLGFLVLGLVLYLILIGEALFVVPAILITFGCFSALVFLYAAVGLGIRSFTQKEGRRG